jgi:hypothetical protein
MSTKAKKAAPAKETKAPKAEKASTKKGAKAAPASELEALVAAQASDASEDDMDEEESAASSSSSAGGNAAALAAATGTGEMSASFKNFRHHPDMENFYRFIYENDLRLEALAIIDEMMVQRANRKMTKSAKLSAH